MIFYLDNISLIFSTTTIIIGYFSNKIANIYMSSEKKKERFFFLLNLFLLSMVYFIHSKNILQLLFF